MKFHINEENGRVSRCRADKYRCPYLHADTVEKARELYEYKMQEQLLPESSNVKKLKIMPQKVLQNTPLKELDTAQLIQALRYEIMSLGLSVETIDSSISLATILHAHQKRANRGRYQTTPYIEHPLRNTLRLIRLGIKNENTIVASILHDTIEDGSHVFVEKFHNIKTGNTEARHMLSKYIKATYGKRVLSLVEAVTNELVADKSIDVETKNRLYVEHVERNVNSDPQVLLIKISDFIDNATGLYHNNIRGREIKTRKQAIKYLPLINVFKNALTNFSDSYTTEQKNILLSRIDVTENRLKQIIGEIG